METVEIEGGVVLVHNDDPEWDWWTIERAEHDGRRWTERTGPSSMTLCLSCRISDADVEGISEHMLGIAGAILNRSDYHVKRCAVDATGDRALFWSPRNSRVYASVSMGAADALANQIRKTIAEDA